VDIIKKPGIIFLDPQGMLPSLSGALPFGYAQESLVERASIKNTAPSLPNPSHYVQDGMKMIVE
jgi:hypothetical protein